MSDIQSFLKANNFTQKEAAAYFECDQSFISQIKTGKRGVPAEFISKAKNDSNMKGVEFLIDDNPIRKNSDLDSDNMLTISKNFKYSVAETEDVYLNAINRGLKMIPEIDFSFAAGPDIIVNSETILRYWYLPDSEDCDAVVLMPGISMLPTLPPGCKLTLKKYGYSVDRVNEIPFGNVFGIVIEDTETGTYHGHIKRIRRHRDEKKAEKYWIARSDNPEFDDFDIDIRQVRSLWIVKEHIITDVVL